MVKQSNEHAPYLTEVVPMKIEARNCPNDNPDYRVRLNGKWGWCNECCNFVNGKCGLGKLPKVV